MSNPQPRETEELLTIAQFAAAIGKTERQVYRYIKQARICTVDAGQTGMSGVRIPASEVDRFQKPIVITRVLQIQPQPQGPEDDSTSDIALSKPQTVPLERHEAAIMRLGFLERELEQSRKILTDGGQELSNLRQQLQEVQEASLTSRVKVELEQQQREKAEKRVEELIVQLALTEEKLRRPWWKFW